MLVRYSKTYRYAPSIKVKDEEGHAKSTFGELMDIEAYIYPASGQTQAQIYGKELPYVYNLLTNEDKLKEGYGICYKSDVINYKVISIKDYTKHFLCEIKKL